MLNGIEIELSDQPKQSFVRKESVSRTYEGVDGYAPKAADRNV